MGTKEGSGTVVIMQGRPQRGLGDRVGIVVATRETSTSVLMRWRSSTRSTQFAIEALHRTEWKPHPESGAPDGCSAIWLLMRSKVRAYSHQGHGPRAAAAHFPPCG